MNPKIKILIKSIAIILIVTLVGFGISFLSKTLNYQQNVETEFLNTTRQKLKKAVTQPNLGSIIDEGGKSFKNFLTSLNIADNSYAFTINKERKYKISNNLLDINGEIDIASSSFCNELEKFADIITQYESANFELLLEKSQNSLYCFIEKIPNSKWFLAVIVLKDSIIMHTIREKKNLFIATTLFILALTLLIGYLGCLFPKTIEKKLWYSTTFVSIILALGTCLLCINSNLRKDYEYPNEIALTNNNIIKGFLDQYDQTLIKMDKKPTKRVKVGVYIKDIELVSSTKVNFTGFLWQKLSKNQVGKIKEGFLFSDANATEITETYENDTPDGGKVHGWFFTTTTKATVKGDLYPFDVEALWLRLTSIDFSDKVIYTPATEDYDNIKPSQLPGIYDDVEIPGWEINKTYFSYVKEKLKTNLGVFKAKKGSVTIPELYYNVIIRRSFIGPFIGIVLPIIVTLVMVFILLLTCSNNEEKTEKLGFSAGAILASTAALFFVIIVEQNDLRSTLASNGIIYMDIYYFVTYLEFMVVNIDSVLLCFPEKFKWIAWKDNILVKCTFWPTVTLIIFFATVYFFFPNQV